MTDRVVVQGKWGRVVDPGGSVASGGEPPYDGTMEARVAKLEADITAIKVDLAVIKANGASKSDIADLRAATKIDIADVKTSVADAKSAIVMWVVGAIILAQVLPSLLKFASDISK